MSEKHRCTWITRVSENIDKVLWEIIEGIGVIRGKRGIREGLTENVT